MIRMLNITRTTKSKYSVVARADGFGMFPTGLAIGWRAQGESFE
jgi:hypothetical protein